MENSRPCKRRDLLDLVGFLNRVDILENFIIRQR